MNGFVFKKAIKSNLPEKKPNAAGVSVVCSEARSKFVSYQSSIPNKSDNKSSSTVDFVTEKADNDEKRTNTAANHDNNE